MLGGVIGVKETVVIRYITTENSMPREWYSDQTGKYLAGARRDGNVQ